MECTTSEDASIILETDAGQTPPPTRRSIQETEIWHILATAEVAKRLGCFKVELESILERIYEVFDIEKMDQLQAIPEHILLRHNIPAAFCQLVKEIKPNQSPRKTLSEVERFLWLQGLDAGLTPDDIKRAVTCIVDVNWLASLDSLRRLPRNQWPRLGLANSIVTRKIQGLIDKLEEGSENNSSSISIVDLLKVVGQRLGKSETCTDALASRLATDHRVETLEDLSNMTDMAFQALNMPLAIANELDSIRRRPAKISGGDGTEGEESRTDYVEPDAETLIAKVGKHFNHPAEEIRMVTDVLVKQHWINTTAKMRRLTPKHWEEFYLSAAFVADLKKALTDPTMLGMNAVNAGAAPLDLFPCDVDFAVDALYDELQDCDKRDVCKSFMRLFEFLLLRPEEAKNRVIRKANPNFLRSAKYESVQLLLHSLGYVDYETHYLLPVLYVRRLETAHERLATLASKLFAAQEGGPSLFGPDSPLRPLWEPSSYAQMLKDSETFLTKLGPSVRSLLGFSPPDAAR